MAISIHDALIARMGEKKYDKTLIASMIEQTIQTYISDHALPPPAQIQRKDMTVRFFHTDIYTKNYLLTHKEERETCCHIAVEAMGFSLPRTYRKIQRK